ncbi:MAG: RDD family protein [Thermoprotei archaeon]
MKNKNMKTDTTEKSRPLKNIRARFTLSTLVYFKRAAAHLIDLAISITIAIIISRISRPLLFLFNEYTQLFLNMFIILIIYSTLTEGILGFTLGKFLFGLRVISTDDEPMNITKAFGRNTFRFLDMILLYIPAFLWWQRIGDIAVSTIVVEKQQRLEIKFFHVTREMFIAVEMQRNNVAQELAKKSIRGVDAKIKLQELMDLEWFLSHAIISENADQEGILEFEQLRVKYNLSPPNF